MEKAKVRDLREELQDLCKIEPREQLSIQKKKKCPKEKVVDE